MARARGPLARLLKQLPVILGGALFLPATLAAQGVTTGAMTGTVVASTGESVVGATVLATHEPSGTQYGTVVREGGSYDIRGLRVGGPYPVVVSMLGFETSQETEVFESRDLLEPLAVSTVEERTFVVPDGSTALTFSWLANNTSGGPGSYEQLVLDDLIPYVESNYCTWAAPGSRFARSAKPWAWSPATSRCSTTRISAAPTCPT